MSTDTKGMGTDDTAHHKPLPFPRPVNGFVGREPELARVRALLPREPLFLIYGVAGIGKSELVYKIVEEARALPSLRRASTIAISARVGLRCEHLLSILRLRLGASSHEPHAGLADDLNAIANALEARTTLVFIDDAHNLDADAAGEVLGYLARHVSRSRIFVASRLELLFPADTPPPAVCRLSPLSREATAALVAGVSHTLGVSPPDPAAVFTRSGGSPFYVLRELSDLRYAPRRGEDSLAAALRDLAAPLRQTLLLARLLRGRLLPSDLRDSEALWELSRRFLIDIDRGVLIVHDLIGEALTREVSKEELRAARRDAALLLLRAEVAPPDRAADMAVDVVEAVRYLAAAGEASAAWEALERWHRLLARFALDHLALEILPALRASLPEQQQEVALRTAQILVRHSRIAEARALLDELTAADAQLCHTVRYLRLSAEIAQRTGALDRAAALLDQALATARDPRERLHIALQLAGVQSRRGEGEAARLGLRATVRVHGTLMPEDEGRLGWVQTLSLLTEGRMAAAGAAAAEAAARLSDGEQAEAARVQLAILEMISRCACDEVEAAAALLRRIQRHESATVTRSAPTVALCQGLLHYTRGELPEARSALDQAHQYLATQSDLLPAAAAGHYLALTLLGLGDNEGAQAAAGRTAQHVIDGGLLCLSPYVAVLEARVHLQALRLREAEAALAPLLAPPGGAALPWVNAQAEALRALLHGLRGEADAARAALERAAGLARQDDTAAQRYELDLLAAEVLLLVGDAAGARARVEAAQAYYEAQGRRHAHAQAALLRAAALAVLVAERARGDPDEDGDAATILSEAEAQLALAQESAERHCYALSWERLVVAALCLRRGEERRAREELSAALRALGAETKERDTRRGPPGLVALMRALDLLPPAQVAAAGQSQQPIVAEAAGQPTGDHDLVVDLRRNVIRARGEGPQVTGRPLLCALLAHLVSDDGAYSAERLFHEVWGGREYHPLRHRNTIYVAIMRLRRVLSHLLPGREVVETTPLGWRLASGVSVFIVDVNARPPRAVPAT